MSQTLSLLEEWVKDVNERLGTEFQVGDDGRLTLEFEGGTRIGAELDVAREYYTLYAPVLTLQGTADLPSLAEALRLNLYQVETDGGTIGLDAVFGVLVYSKRLATASTNGEVFAVQLENFVGWTERLSRHLEAIRSDDLTDQDLPLMGEMFAPADPEDDDKGIEPRENWDRV